MHHHQVSSHNFFFTVTSLTFCGGYSIESFTMTAGKTLSLTGLADGTTVNLLGDVTFGVRYEYSLICYVKRSH
jgi:hypothetical protein